LKDAMQSESATLLPKAGGASRMTRTRVYLAVAAVSAMAAVGVVASFVGKNGGSISTLSAAAPVIYYYMPEVKHAGIHRPQHMQILNETGNETAGAGDAADGADAASFVCTLANIQALSAEVQGKWDKCKDNKNYEEPNKGAARRLMGWVWEPETKGEMRTAVPAHLPSHYRLKLDEGTRANARSQYHQSLQMQSLEDNSTAANGTAGNATADAGGGTDEPSMDECEKTAAEKACADIAACENPVCESYYNEPDVEALCGMCTMSPLGGCFAHTSTVQVEGREVMMGNVAVGDRVLANAADGSSITSRVIFVHDHKEASPTLRISYGDDAMELTQDHLVPIVSEACGDAYCESAQLVAAKTVRAGDKIYVASASSSVIQEVSSVSKSFSKVRYVLTEHDTIVVNGVVASVYSTAAGSIETLPFRLFDSLFSGGLQWAPVAEALKTILESPALRAMELVINKMGQMPTQASSRATARAVGVSFSPSTF